MAAETLKTEAPVFWAQLGLENEEAANLLLNEGRQVIMNRCIKIELAKWQMLNKRVIYKERAS